jgi:ferric-dicitrate binding protein FerR (iron transport regulator)
VRKRLTRAEAKSRQRKAQRRWRELHPDYAKEWQAANRDYVTQQKRKYRERKKYGNEI